MGRPDPRHRTLFEFLILEGAQAGVPWAGVLRRREAYRRAFDGVGPAMIVRYGTASVQQPLAKPGIVHNLIEVQRSITNAATFLDPSASAENFDA